jgi:hypothetical protein
MEWFYPILVVVGLLMLGVLLVRYTDRFENLGILVTVIALVALLVVSILAPTSYYDYRCQALQAEAFYDMIQNNIIEEGEDYVVVSGIGAGIWQAGSVTEFNSYLRSVRYWDGMAFIGWFIFPAPDHLKEVRLSSE